MDYLQLLVSAVVGALFGGLASVATATRISEGSERGREREAARQRLLARVRAYRAAVSGRTGLLSRSRRMPVENPTTESSAVRFAEQIELELPSVSHRLAARVREHLDTLIGPTDAAIAREVAFIPEAERHHEWKSDAFLRVKEQVPIERVLSKGLLGAVRVHDAPGSAGEAVVAELRAMEATVLNAPSRRLRRRQTGAVTPLSLR